VRPELSRFYGALTELEAKRRSESVRVLWFGDSHTAADFLPNAVREPLQAKFGNGGPGFVYLGLKVYRHAGLAASREGRFRMGPRAPSFWERQDDGVFGLGGMRMSPQTPESSATIALSSGAVVGGARWEISYRLKAPRSGFKVRVGTETHTVTQESSPPGPSGISRFSFETGEEATVVLAAASGEPELFGATIDSVEAGVVVDTLGINGARIGTPVAWDESAWVEEVRWRRPSLVVLAYGTNEVGDALAPERYAGDYDELVARIRTAAPEADCLIIGPTDRAEPDWTTHPRVLEVESVERASAARLGCAFQSAFELMGGPGSLKQWSERSPPLASSDRVHLTAAGYRELGGAIARALLDGYSGAR
jgi:lysophospholipase L1-like esterase